MIFESSVMDQGDTPLKNYQYLCEALSSTAVVYEAPRIEAP